MGVQREVFKGKSLTGELRAAVEELVRNPSGDWTFRVHLSGAVPIGDGRTVVINRSVATKATEQVGRKQRSSP